MSEIKQLIFLMGLLALLLSVNAWVMPCPGNPYAKTNTPQMSGN